MPRISCGSVELDKFIGYDTSALRTGIALLLLVSFGWAQTQLQQALTLTRAGRFREARDLIAGVPVPAAVPQQIAYHRLKAAIASGLHENNAAATEMEAALALSPDDRSLLLGAAVSEQQAGHLDQAVELLSRAGDTAEAKALLGDLFEKIGHHGDALAEYRDAVRLDPKREAFRTALGKELIALGAFEEADAELRKSLALFPNSAPLLTLLGILQYSGGQTEEAKQVLVRAIEADATYQPAYLTLAKIILESSGSPGEQDVSVLCRGDKITCSAVQLRVAREKNDKELERQAVAVLRVAPPGNVTAVCALGQAYAWNDRPQDARPKLERCVQLDPTPQNHYRLAQVYRKLGETVLAQQQLNARSKLLKALSEQTAKAVDSLKALESQIK
ncbi:MAG: tetratricopeptide repeat protein [Bryobacteraceae bacterium]